MNYHNHQQSSFPQYLLPSQHQYYQPPLPASLITDLPQPPVDVDYTDEDSDDDDDNRSGSSSTKRPTQSDAVDGVSMAIRRKQRRGKIEKRRRDRINHCLSELRRLVPAAFERHGVGGGAQKLEKAEILQLTVEHLKAIQAGNTTMIQDRSQYAFTSGYRACSTAVDKCLSNEGIDIQDHRRERLDRYLQCTSASSHWPITSQQNSCQSKTTLLPYSMTNEQQQIDDSLKKSSTNASHVETNHHYYLAPMHHLRTSANNFPSSSTCPTVD